MALAKGFHELPLQVRDLAPLVVKGINGAILGVVGGDTPAGQARYMAVVEASLIEVYNHSPSAPPAVLREATIRHAAWLLGCRPNVIASRSEDPSGTALQLQFANQTATANAMRASGAGQLLGRYRRRHASVIRGSGA